jgi:transcription elongation factor Elf1
MSKISTRNKEDAQKEMKRKVFKERYDFKCAKCGKELWAAPSIMMTGFGMNQGHGSCLKCKTFLHLEIIPDIYGEEMISEEWDGWLKNHIPLKETSWGGEGFSKGIPPSPLIIKCTKEVKQWQTN